uniref:Uncharacterized protein n=1 Tax=Opuntia streptacantha TaxID=393608 RepID=A0A7C9CKH1_OPUST
MPPSNGGCSSFLACLLKHSATADISSNKEPKNFSSHSTRKTKNKLFKQTNKFKMSFIFEVSVVTVIPLTGTFRLIFRLGSNMSPTLLQSVFESFVSDFRNFVGLSIHVILVCLAELHLFLQPKFQQDKLMPNCWRYDTGRKKMKKTSWDIPVAC